MKEKRKRQHEKNLPRRQRRKLEAAREMLEEENEGEEKNKKERNGISLVDVAYRRAKAVKAAKRAVDAGKIVKKAVKKSKNPSQTNKSRPEEMRELFQDDMSAKKQKNLQHGDGKNKSSFKSKSRYKCR